MMFILTKLTLKKILYLLYPLIIFSELIMLDQFTPLRSNFLLNLILTAISMTFIGIFKQIYDLYTYHKNKIELKKYTSFSNKKRGFTKIIQIHEHNKNKVTAIVILGMSFIYLIGDYCQTIISKQFPEYKQVNLLFYQIFQLGFNILFTKLLVKVIFYKYHYLSLGLITIGIIGFHVLSVSFTPFFTTVPFYFLFSFAWAFIFPYAKIIMEKKYIHPLSLSFYLGLRILIIFGITYSISLLIGHFSAINPEYTKDFIKFFDSFLALFNNSTNTLLTLVYTIIAGIRANAFLIIINLDSPITENILN